MSISIYNENKPKHFIYNFSNIKSNLLSAHFQNCDPKKINSQMLLNPKLFGSQNYFDPKKCSPQIFLDPKICDPQKFEILIPNKFGPPKNVEPQTEIYT